MTKQQKKTYLETEAHPNIPEIEAEILAYWERENIFQTSIDQRPSLAGGASNEYIFYDGPPFANGLPHYGHLATGFVKDLIPRYHTMRGRRVERQFGWDCHGLPAELTSEKELGISGRNAIINYGIEQFNDHCQKSVLRFTDEWRQYITQQGRWVDFQNPYKTMDLSFMESVLWAFKQLYDRGLIYQGYRVVPYSWAMQTPLSNFETRIDDSYRERQDPALTVKFDLTPREDDPGPISILAWTTTPWTLPSNLALAVSTQFDYALLEKNGEYIILADAARARYPELEPWRKVKTLKGSELVQRSYRPLFPYFADAKPAFIILDADFVELDEGTGIIHIAPGFGEEDLALGQAHGLPLITPVDEQGKFTARVKNYAGLNVIEANKPIIRDLKQQHRIIRHETYLHNYPHCWRTDTPLIYKAINAWYVKVSSFRQRMTEINQNISWTPSHIRDGLFGK